VNRSLFLLPVLLLAQAPDANIRIDVNLVQVDAVVTDSHGRHVPGLAATDFDIRQDGKSQTITNFSYITGASSHSKAAVAVAAKPTKSDIPAPPVPLEASEVHRTLALVVDDLGLAGENIPPVRNAVKNFVDEQMQPGDLVAIIRTSAGMGALQQFTTDKRLLYAAIERIKYGQSRVGVSTFTPLGSGGSRGTVQLDHLREQTFSVGSLAALEFVVNALRPFPARKSVILFTENIRLIFQGTTDAVVERAVARLTDAASRASVVIHAIDPRGMPNYELTAADNTAGMSRRRVARVPQQREEEVIRTEDGAFQLSEATGGLFLKNTSDLAGALRKAADDSSGYYLIGYHPDAATFEGEHGQARFHRIEVRVKGAGLHVRTREGFFGEPGADPAVEHTREAEIVHALQSPYAAGAIHPRVTAVFSNVPKRGSMINALLYVNRGELNWSNETDGSHKASLDVAAAAFDENGLAFAPIDTTYNLHLPADHFADALKKGEVYGIRVAVNKPGPYVVRAAVRDAATGNTGSGQQFVEAPDIAGGHMALSGLVLLESEANPSTGDDASLGTARRGFRRGTVLAYGYELINAAHAGLEAETRVFHKGQIVSSGKAELTADAAAPQRFRGMGRLAIGVSMAPGEYVLQVIVRDKLAKGASGVVTQSMDFEIEP
jgi:VWFA-related protein